MHHIKMILLVTKNTIEHSSKHDTNEEHGGRCFS